MSDAEIPATHFFAAPPASLAAMPHLITALDAPLLNALVRINGSKPGIWNVSPPYDENDAYVPYREEFVFSEWSLGYNQNELLKAEAFEPGTVIVDSDTKMDVLQAIDQSRPEDESGTRVGYQDYPDFPALLKQTGWALIPVRDTQAPDDTPAERGIFVTSESKKDFVELAKKWCHANGRTFYTLAAKGADYVLIPRHAPDEARQKAVWYHGQQFLHKMAVQGISPAAAKAHLDALIAQIASAQK